jgi:hypothetical protein
MMLPLATHAGPLSPGQLGGTQRTKRKSSRTGGPICLRSSEEEEVAGFMRPPAHCNLFVCHRCRATVILTVGLPQLEAI